MHRLALLLSLILKVSLTASAQLTLVVTVPQDTPLLDSIHVAGNFNNWDPSDPSTVLTRNTDGTYQISLTPMAGDLSFKFTRGSWPTVEADALGSDIADRTLTYNGNRLTAYLFPHKISFGTLEQSGE